MHVTLRYNAISGLCNGAAFAMRERKETPFFYAQIKRVTKVRGQNCPTGRNRMGATQLDAADWLIRRPRPGCTLSIYPHSTLCSIYDSCTGQNGCLQQDFSSFCAAGTNKCLDLCVYRQAFDNR